MEVERSNFKKQSFQTRNGMKQNLKTFVLQISIKCTSFKQIIKFLLEQLKHDSDSLLRCFDIKNTL